MEKKELIEHNLRLCVVPQGKKFIEVFASVDKNNFFVMDNLRKIQSCEERIAMDYYLNPQSLNKITVPMHLLFPSMKLLSVDSILPPSYTHEYTGKKNAFMIKSTIEDEKISFKKVTVDQHSKKKSLVL